MKIAVGADHRGTEVRAHLCDWLKQPGFEVVLQTGAASGEKACDYPDVAYTVGRAVVEGRADRGILICCSGIGMSIAANKIKGVRAALVHDEVGAEMSRRHNDANVLCLSGDMLGIRFIDRIVKTWLTTEFEGGRHVRRVQKITELEQGVLPISDALPA